MQLEEGAKVGVDMFRVVVIAVSVDLSGGEQVEVGLVVAEVVEVGQAVVVEASADLAAEVVVAAVPVVVGKYYMTIHQTNK